MIRQSVKRELLQVIKSLKAYMQAKQFAGIEEFYLGVPPAGWTLQLKRSVSLEDVRQQVLRCRQCPLHKSRQKPVFGEGNPRARLVFVGEAPGREEDMQGLPFVGGAGELLTRIIEAMGLTRKDVYICNVLKCRPPQNRDPLPTEIASCRIFLERQLEIIRPRVICCLGRYACSLLTNQDLPITSLRGKFFDFGRAKVMPTFHPAYLLRNPQAKRLVWSDMQKVMAELNRKQRIEGRGGVRDG